MAKEKESIKSKSFEIIPFAGIAPTASGLGNTNESYSSSDGKTIYIQFSDIDSSGIYPLSGIHTRFSVNKFFGAIATTVTPISYYVDTSLPKTAQLQLADSDKLVDGLYNGITGIITSVQTVSVSYTTSTAGGLGTIPLLSDNDTSPTYISSFSGLGVSNRTSEANPPEILYSYSSTDGSKVYAVFREATPPILPISGIGGFAITQGTSNKNILNAYVLDPTSTTDGKIVVLDLQNPLSINDSSNPITLSYTKPSLSSIRLKDSSSLGNETSSFSGISVTNLTSETVLPRVVDAYTSTSGTQYVYVQMSEPTLPGTSATGFSIYANNVLKSISSISVGNTNYSGIGVSLYRVSLGSTFFEKDYLELDYQKPTSNFITDQSANLNQLSNFNNRFYIRNLFNQSTLSAGDISGVFSNSESFVDTNGKDIYLYFNINRYQNILPSTNISGFYVYVDGQSCPLKSSIALDRSYEAHIKLSLHNRIHKGSTVKIGYIKGNLTDSNSKAFASFEPLEILNNAKIDRSDLFDIYDWNNDTSNSIGYDFEITENTSELFRKSDVNINSSVIIDTEPPKGILILNRSSEENETGIKVHKFSVYGQNIEESGDIIDYDFSTNSLAWSVQFDQDVKIKNLTVKLKYTNEFLNKLDYVRFSLFLDNNENKPELTPIVTDFGYIVLNNITEDYTEIPVVFNSTLSLSANTKYWIRISTDTIISEDENNLTELYVATHSSTGNYIAETNTNIVSTWLAKENKSVFYKLVTNDIVLDSKDYVLDLFEKPIREALYYSDSSYQKYELIGDSNSNYLLKKLSKIYNDELDSANDIYPLVSKIEVGAFSGKPKNYILEFKSSPESDWIQLFDTLTDETTLNTLVYELNSAVRMSDVRLVYKGDYFTIDSQGKLTIAAYDDLSEVTDIQISHFSDFRDAPEFPNSTNKGFIDYQEGLTEYQNWDISNLKNVFKQTKGFADSDITASIVFNSKLILAANNKIYIYYNGETSTISNNEIVDSNDQITSFAIYKNKVYLGTTSGLLYSSLTGDFWSIVNGSDPYSGANSNNAIKPIYSLGVMGDKLYIGTSKGSSNSPSIYTYDGRSIKKLKDFDTAFSKVSAISSANFYLFAGISGDYGSEESIVYTYNGLEWQQTLAAKFDSVDSLSYSTARNSMVVAFRGGDIWELPYSNNLPTSWGKIYDTNSDRNFGIFDDASGEYLFITSDTKAVIYIKSIDSFKVITSYKSDTNGLNLNWKKYASYSDSYSSDIADIENISYESYKIQNSGINTTNFSSVGFTNNSSVSLEGFIKASADGSYKFKLISNMGSKLTLGGVASTSNFTNTSITSDLTLESPQTYSLAKNELLDFKLESFISSSTTPSLNLYWKNTDTVIDYEVLPVSQMVRKSKIKSIFKLNNNYYGVGSDGRVYLFDASFYATKVRNVYARFRDEAGNIQGVVINARNKTYDIYTDKVTQDLNTVNETYQTKGKIYQIAKNSDNTLETKYIYTPSTRSYSIYAPDRKLKAIGVYEAQPFYVPTLVKWSKITNLIVNKYALNTVNGEAISGLDAGTSVKVYVRTGNTRSECLSASWSSAYEVSYINNNSYIPPIETQEINIDNFTGKWLQYKFELISATKNLSPEIVSTTVTYTAGTASYYFTKVFDTSDYDTSSPVIRRGLLTSNELLNNGTITYGYLTTDDPADVYDFNKYQQITPNRVFEIDEPTNKIKFGILFTSVGSNPSVVYDFAVQLDTGDSNIKFMPSL